MLGVILLIFVTPRMLPVKMVIVYSNQLLSKNLKQIYTYVIFTVGKFN